jgi:hexosaminidase
MSLSDGINSGTDTIGKVTIRYITDNTLNDEGYEIHISEKGIKIIVKTPKGAFYAAQSLSQMIWKVTDGIKKSSIEMRSVIISDAPKYAWRGFHLDVARHFFTKEYIMQIIDELSYYKINKLHLHLTDDQGWRVEISQFPLLTELGAWRTFNNQDSICIEKARTDLKYTIDNRFIKVVNGETVYGGYYNKQDIRDIVAYASEHFVDVVPEIDMPGHMSAAIKAYPFLSCTGSVGWGKEFSYPVCPCNEDVMNFCYKVWDEIADLFPYPVVHIGSDEVEKNTWETSTECGDFMKQNGFHNINEIQNYFVNDIQHYLESKGKTVIAWDDVIDGKVDNNLVLMYWRDWLKDSPERCARNGNSIILTPWSPFYVSGNHTDQTLQDLYQYDPEAVFSSDVVENVIGIQICVWTEEIPSEEMFEYLVYPRMQALSEVAWSAGKDWNSFKIRLESHLRYMNSKHIGYRKPTWAK